jgi:PPOX class probable F420-dependent enzyme
LERWRAIEARLGREATVWLATVRNDGRPHLVPVWFVWHNEHVYFTTAGTSQKYANLRYNQRVALSLSDPYSVVIIEGEAHATDRQTTEEVAEQFVHKYEWDFRLDESADWRLVQVRPGRVLAWGDGYDDEGIRVL